MKLYRRNVIFLIIILFMMNACSKHRLEKNWFLIGGNIRMYVELKKEKVLRLSEEKKLIFEAKIKEYKFIEEKNAKLKLKLNVAIQKVGKDYQLKYARLKNALIWMHLKDKKMEMIVNELHNRPYVFAVQASKGNQKPFRFLESFELEKFKADRSFQDVKKDYNLRVLINKKPAMSPEAVQKLERKARRIYIRKRYNVGNMEIRNMQDYLLDMDFSTYWATDQGDYWGTEMEIFIKDSVDKRLKESPAIRALYFNTGNLHPGQKSKYYQFHRIKKMRVSFSEDYEGSLGSSKANYNQVKYFFELPDNMEEKVIVFLEPVRAKSIRIEYQDFYMGYEDAFAIYDFTVFVDSE